MSEFNSRQVFWIKRPRFAYDAIQVLEIVAAVVTLPYHLVKAVWREAVYRLGYNLDSNIYNTWSRFNDMVRDYNEEQS